MTRPRAFLPQWQAVHELAMREQMRQAQMASKRRDAERAWQMRDYQEVVNAYSSISDHLSPAESKKLDYARKKMAGAT